METAGEPRLDSRFLEARKTVAPGNKKEMAVYTKRITLNSHLS